MNLHLEKVSGPTYPRYGVWVDGKLVGHVGRHDYTEERRTPGKRYVNARYTVRRWYYERLGERMSGGWLTRRRALAMMFQCSEHELAKAPDVR